MLRLGLLYAVLLLICCAAFAIGYRKTSVANGGLVVESRSLDFGSAWDGTHRAMKFSIKNPTSLPISVINMVTSCSCTSVRPRTFIVEAGASQVVEAELDLRAWRNDKQNGDKTVFQASIIPQIENSSTRPTPWIITGEIKRLVKVSVPNNIFSCEAVVGRPREPFDATVTYLTTLEGLTAACNPTKAAVNVEGGPRVFKLHISPRSDLPPGLTDFDITVQPKHATEDLPTSQWKMLVKVHQLVEPVPSTVSFGALPLGQIATQSITLMSRGDISFTIEAWKSANTNTIVEPLVSAPGAATPNKAFKVTQRITELGSQQSAVVFSVRTAEQGDLIITCPIQYHGLPQATTKR